jgi:hypothetical protein
MPGIAVAWTNDQSSQERFLYPMRYIFDKEVYKNSPDQVKTLPTSQKFSNNINPK